jgi:single-strand DNA-binding protein
MAILNLATNRIYKDKTGNLKEETEYHRVVAWGKLAEVCHQNLNKGRLIFVEGRIRSRSWIDAQGNKRVTYEIIAENIKFGPKPGSDVIEKNLEELEAELEDYKLETPEEFGILDIPF